MAKSSADHRSSSELPRITFQAATSYDLSTKVAGLEVQTDVISVMLNTIESLILFDLLLAAYTFGHINVSLEMLSKLVVAFGSVITSANSAPPAVGVDLNAKKRLQSYHLCHVHLQKIHKILTNVIRATFPGNNRYANVVATT
ncbi:G-protein beta WD-40 repeat-containing protein [Artemisia annua]|uniref:G-protein beta WD-40 repeat-containing protein n=1 Tax=Artemisia annua TaxID=35608 RepID=A0A2U1KPU6_ARTAN|nr:G-protein beta WD-40 repeat-containing protein [Artemisia annua]